MINWFDMPAEGLSNGGQFEVKELEVTENGTYEEKGEMYNKVTVNVEGGGGETWNTVFEGSVTTEIESEVDFALGGFETQTELSADSIKVLFDGTEYILPKNEMGYGSVGESGPDFSEYPLFISKDSDTYCNLLTHNAGTYTLKIEEPQSGGSNGEFKIANITWTNLPESFDDYSACRGCLLVKTEEGFDDYYDVHDFSELILVWDDEWSTSPKAIVITNQPENIGDLAVWVQPYQAHDFAVVSGDAFIWNRGVIIYGDCTLTIS